MSAALESTIELPDLSHALDVGDLSLWERFIELICLKHNIACTEVQCMNSRSGSGDVTVHLLRC